MTQFPSRYKILFFHNSQHRIILVILLSLLISISIVDCFRGA